MRTASAPRRARACSTGCRSRTPTSSACRKPRRRSTSLATRISGRRVITAITSTPRRKATAAWRSTAGSSRGRSSPATVRASSTRKAAISRRGSRISRWFRSTFRRAPRARSVSARSSASWPNSCPTCDRSSASGATSSCAATGTSRTSRSICATGARTRRIRAFFPRNAPGSTSSSTTCASSTRFARGIRSPTTTPGGPIAGRPGRRTSAGASTTRC